MLLNPYREQLQVVAGTRILETDLGLAGFTFVDPVNPQRIWVLQHLLAPVKRRHIDGIRAKFEDAKGFIAFCNQRDLELLLGLAQPGDYCPWLDEYYPSPIDREFFGLCADDEDLKDDLFERELRLREQYPGILPQFLEVSRRIHNGSVESEELFTLLGDVDFYTGISPDTKLETVENRWSRVERSPVKWAAI